MSVLHRFSRNHAARHAVGGEDELGTDFARLSDPFGFGLISTFDPLALGGAVAWTTANRAVYLRVVGGGPVSKIGLEVGVSSGNVSVAVYRNSGVGRAAAPGTRLATSGALACPTAGYAEISLGASVAVQPGDWFAVSCDNGTAQFRVENATALVSNIYNGRLGYQDAAHPCPSVPSPTAGAIRAVLLVGVA